MSESTHKIAIKAGDYTAGAFESIKNRARVTGAQIGSMLGGAIVAAGAYFGFSKLSEGVDELSNLNDVAKRAGLSVEELTKLTTAFDIAGIKGLGIDEIAKAFGTLEEKTGRSGLEGFFTTIEELGKIDDLKERRKAVKDIFGGAGDNLMPLINAANNGTQAIRNVIAAIGGVSTAAAKSGDAVSDAKKIGASAFHNIWLRAIGAVCGLFDVDIRGGAVKMAAYMEYGAAVSWRYIKAFFGNVEGGGKRWELVWQSFKDAAIRNVVILSATCHEIIKQVPERLANGMVNIATWPIRLISDKYNKLMGDWGDSLSTRLWTNVDKDLKELGVSIKSQFADDISDAFKDVDVSDLERKLKEVLDKSKTFTKDLLDSTLPTSGRRGPVGLVDEVAKQKPKIRNDLILGGSNESLKLATFGPSLQNEQKKTNKFLEEIVAKLGNVERNQREEGGDEYVFDV